MLRVERKLNSALNEKLSNRIETYTQTKIKNLHNLQDEVEKEDSKADSMYTGNNVSQFTDQNSMHHNNNPDYMNMYNQKMPPKQSNKNHIQEDLFEKEKEYMQKISETKSTIANLKLEVKNGNDTVEALKKKIQNERENFKVNIIIINNNYIR